MPLGNLAATHAGFAESTPVGVFFTGSTALAKGQAVCYDRDYGTAADAEGRRGNYVEACSTTNNQFFAGVAVRDYPAVTGGQPIQIYIPGSICPVSVVTTTTVASTLMTALASSGASVAGRFVPAGLPGRGTMRVLQTISAVSSPTSYVGGPISSSIDGSAVLTVSGTTYTLTKTAAFANVPATANLTGEEYIYLLAGATDNPGAAATVQPTPGRYKITSKTSDDAVVLDPAGTAPTSAASTDVAFYCVRGNPTCLALLEDGRESGLVEWLSPYTDGSGTTTVDSMVGGYTRIFGGFDLDNGDAIHSLADGTFIGQRKAWFLVAAITTNDYMVNATSSNIVALATSPADASQAVTDLNYQAIASFEFDAASDYVLLEWSGVAWVLIHFSGVTLA